MIKPYQISVLFHIYISNNNIIFWLQVPVHAPMTEALSTLDRDQLQKLLQYAVHEDPAGILGKVFKHLGRQQSFSPDGHHGPQESCPYGRQNTGRVWGREGIKNVHNLVYS